MASPENMNGLWSGWYAYARFSQPVTFTAWIDDTSGLLTGTILEPNTFSSQQVDDLQSEVAGTRDGHHIFFSKTYLSGQGAHDRPIAYNGLADSGFELVRGEWSFAGPHWGHGAFELKRASGSISEGILKEVFATMER